MITARCLLIVPALLMLSGPAFAESWYVSFEPESVPPVARSDTASWVELGAVDTDGFKELVFSLGGEFKEGVPSAGRVGAVLIPDLPRFEYLLRNEGQIVFPLEVTFDVKGKAGAIFISPQQTAKVAFPSYRVYLYNETESVAAVSLHIYRTR